MTVHLQPFAEERHEERNCARRENARAEVIAAGDAKWCEQEDVGRDVSKTHRPRYKRNPADFIPMRMPLKVAPGDDDNENEYDRDNQGL